MIESTRTTLAAMLLMLVYGCVASPPGLPGEGEAGIEIRGLLIQNRSYGMLSEVILLVVQTGEFISCGNIPMRGECSTTFPLRQYQGNDVEIRWKEGGREWSTGEFVVDPGAETDPAYPALVRVIITPAGTAVTELVQ